MAYKDANGFDHASGETQASDAQTLQISSNTVELPHESFVRDADISRDGADLVLDGPDGTIIVESYFSGAQSPALIAPNGATLTPELVNSFASSGNQYAKNTSMNDASPIGAVQEISGDATITRGDGSTQELSIGSPVYQGDIIETDAGSAVNVVFIDESSFAVSEETRLAIDEYVFDPASQGGVQNFSVLKGVFVYTSGLIGREDPDDVSIETPVGSIGIRGTIIAGDVNQGEITVVEGAIVLRTPGGEEMTLASQFETGRFTANNGIQNIGQKSANDVVEKFSIVSKVAPTLFSSINDAAAENAAQAQESEATQEPVIDTPQDQDAQTFDADGATDQDGDSEVDGTVDDTSASEGDSNGAALDASESAEDAAQADVAPQDMNPMATQIAQAMGMMNGQNGAPMMGGDAQGMGAMATMAMANNDALMNGETMMDGVMDAENAIDKISMIEARMADLRGLLGDPSVINPKLLKKAALEGNAPVNFKDAGIGIDRASIAPDDFFASGEGNEWIYQFDNEFTGSANSFALSAPTLNTLNDLVTEGIIVTGGIQFDSANGRLSLEFVTDFGALITNGTSRQIEINVAAINENGSSDFTQYDFDIYNDTGIVAPWGTPTGDISSATNGTVFNSPAGISSVAMTIGNTNATNAAKIFFGDDNDSVEFGSGNAVTDNIINLGNGNNTITTNSGTGSVNNTIIGGNQIDTFQINEAENKFHGLDGNDRFVINITDTAGTDEAIDKLNNNASDILIDGGSGHGRGDTLELTGNDTIDFSAINDSFIRGIERIEFGAGNQTAVLSYNDVIQMTDGGNRLVIRADGGDNITFSDFTGKGFDPVRVESIDDSPSGAGGATNFDVFTNGNVTLVVEQGIATAAEFA